MEFFKLLSFSMLGALTGSLLYYIFSGNNFDWKSLVAILIGVLVANFLAYKTKKKDNN
ncbi:hypothetical protein [Cytobacillus sp. FSL K6-0265]|uniref:hypothetical protein n=1 Tax=Cytobacillus sp. FSL K6-0265 TaxID=2921448 RepID=UPI0030FA92AE